MATYQESMQMLKLTSRTFYLPIVRLPKGIREAVASGYLCLRAIDEVEDHPTLEAEHKARILHTISQIFQAQTSADSFAYHALETAFVEYHDVLPEVTLRVGEWACLAPTFIAPRVWEATATMADRMAHWAANGFEVVSIADLDRYTYGVAGAVGLLLCDLWAWFEKIQIHRTHAIQFGRGLQTVNILRNRSEDLSRGVNFFPEDWDKARMFAYARENLDSFSDYAKTLPKTTFMNFVAIPRALAYATLNVLERGEKKLTRKAVMEIVKQLESKA
ncbi:MAG: phytoene/squalene synthase family protein [Anaerolineaceae bacterium 4572_5.1]|nr:MAG: phytoene/squalene synthase family protein [Anaerolineaceae bacterium 4572_5.1]RLD11657.1 MAG: phytoene/squalene synthase family protein [Chloroflexota bacterium]